MQAKQLANLLLRYPDFEVHFNDFEADNSSWGMTLHTYEITGVGDIGYSDKVIILDGREI